MKIFKTTNNQIKKNKQIRVEERDGETKMYRIKARHRMWREKMQNMGKGTLGKDRGSPAKINQTSTIHGEEALMSYRSTKQKMVEKANTRNRADNPQIYLTPGTLVLLRNEGEGTFGADKDTEYVTLERGNSKV